MVRPLAAPAFVARLDWESLRASFFDQRANELRPSGQSSSSIDRAADHGNAAVIGEGQPIEIQRYVHRCAHRLTQRCRELIDPGGREPTFQMEGQVSAVVTVDG